ncbi:MAG: hypothetical protein N3A63_02645 [Bacteroidetes bacterium]|nr:hypothetical protein [Bacteroidota bacterium]
MKRFISILSVFLTFLGCAPLPEQRPTTTSIPKLEYVVRVASLNLKNFTKRFDQKDIHTLASLLKSDSIDIVTIQNITRYPDLPARVDFIKEFSKVFDAQVIFGEMLNSSGKQLGNAIFSIYPILSHANISFDKIDRTSFDAALLTLLDIGITHITVISAQFPENIRQQQLMDCVHLVYDSTRYTHPYIITGNMFLQEHSLSPLAEIQHQYKKITGTLWYNRNAFTMKKPPRLITTPLGYILITELQYTGRFQGNDQR